MAAESLERTIELQGQTQLSHVDIICSSVSTGS